jgi:hypothetical protein
VKFTLYNKAGFIPGLNVYCCPLLKSLPCASNNAGKETAWNIGPVNECEAQSVIIPFVGIIIRKEYELRQQCHFVFISQRVATMKQADFRQRQNVLLVACL